MAPAAAAAIPGSSICSRRRRYRRCHRRHSRVLNAAARRGRFRIGGGGRRWGQRRHGPGGRCLLCFSSSIRHRWRVERLSGLLKLRLGGHDPRDGGGEAGTRSAAAEAPGGSVERYISVKRFLPCVYTFGRLFVSRARECAARPSPSALAHA